jgi:GH35 family endo-1,4-beta-xylanase
MRKHVVSIIVGMASCLGFANLTRAQTSITGGNLAYKSLGTQSTTLSATGYLGTYLTIPAGGATVNLDVNANATSASAPADMELVVGNQTVDFTVSGTTAANYNAQNITLPAGTYFVRAERDYDNGVNQSFAINNLSVSTVSGSSASFANDAENTTAAANDATKAANTDIDNYREGAMNLTINGVASGTPVEIKEINSAFKWGTNVPDSFTNTTTNVTTQMSALLGSPTATGSTPTTYSTLLKQNFNSVTPENAGKWSESSTTAQLDNLDSLTAFASQNNIRVRMHNLVWGSQQASNVNTDFTNAQSSNPTTAAAGKAAITAAITGRINSYVSGTNSITGQPRASEFSELDVYNESYNTGANASTSTGDNYWKVMGGGTAAGGAAWTAGLYNQVQTAVSSVGANTKLFTNDYNILNNSSDQYGQTYSQHVESIRNGNGANTGAVSGIGTEWYNTPGVGTDGSEVDPARAYATWQNLSAQGLPLEVTEFGETGSPSATTATSLTTAMTLAFGTQNMTGFTLWGMVNDGPSMYSGSTGSVLFDNNYNITANGTAYEALQKYWTTDDDTVVNANGSVTLPSTLNADGTTTQPDTAFYGNYEAIINGVDYPFSFNSSTGTYVISIPEPAPLGVAAVAFLTYCLIRRSKRSSFHAALATTTTDSSALPSRQGETIMRNSHFARGTMVIIAFAAAAALSSRAQAVAIFTWDAGTAGGNGSHSSSPQDGSGTWSTTNLNWTSTGTGADVGWTNSTSNPALIGSNNNAVTGIQDITLGGAITLGNLTFGTVNGGSYDILGTSSNTLGMTGSTPTITVNSAVTAEIDAPISVTGSQPDVTVTGSGTLDLNPTVEGSNYHGVILAGTSNVVLLSAAAVPLAIPNNTTAANFDGGTLTFAATPTTDVSGRFTTTSTSAVNIGVTNGALVTFGSPIGGSGGFNLTGSGAGSKLEMTESGGSQVAFSGSGGVNVNGATLYLTGSHNNEFGSNAVTVGVNGTLSSDSTKLVTTGSTNVNGAITGGSGATSGSTYGNMHLSATTFNSTGVYDWKLNTAPTSAYHTGSVVNSVMTSAALNGNSLTNFDTLFMSSLTDTASGFGVKLVTTVGSGTPLANGSYEFAIANAASGTFNTSNFTYSGFTLADVADSSLSAANNGGVNSELNGGTGQDLILTYTTGHNIISLTAASSGAPTVYGSSQGTLTVNGSNGSYTPVSVTLSTAVSKGYVEGNGFSPATDTEIYGLDVRRRNQPQHPRRRYQCPGPGCCISDIPGCRHQSAGQPIQCLSGFHRRKSAVGRQLSWFRPNPGCRKRSGNHFIRRPRSRAGIRRSFRRCLRFAPGPSQAESIRARMISSARLPRAGCVRIVCPRSPMTTIRAGTILYYPQSKV